MTPIQHQQIAALMERLANIQLRMATVKNVFPNHYMELRHSYNQMLLEARAAQVVPPWMLG